MLQRRELISIIFDGTTRLGEALVIVMRYLDDQWKLCQRIVSVAFKKHDW